MRFPKLTFVFMFVGCLVVYLTYVKRHYDDSKPPVSDQLPQYRMDTHKQSTSAQVVSENFQYGIMFDAGSTGTRIHIFKFQIEPNGMLKFKRYLSSLVHFSPLRKIFFFRPVPHNKSFFITMTTEFSSANVVW